MGEGSSCWRERRVLREMAAEEFCRSIVTYLRPDNAEK
jgi:hypothetical protein